jgi:hypothetical protein
MAKRKPKPARPLAKRGSGVDFEQLRRDIAGATRRTFTAIRAGCPGERLYAFALYSDGSAMTVCPAANTEEAYRRALAKAGASEPEQVNYYRWAFPEWSAGAATGAEEFNAICSTIGGRDRYDAQDPHGFVRFKARVYATMVLALLDLVNEGLFGPGKDRDQLTLLCSEADSGCAVWLEDQSARWLNSGKVYKAFRKEWKTYMADDLELFEEDPDDIYREFVRYLDGEQVAGRRGRGGKQRETERE